MTYKVCCKQLRANHFHWHVPQICSFLKQKKVFTWQKSSIAIMIWQIIWQVVTVVVVIQRQRCLSGNRLINSHSLFVTESNKTLGRTEGLGTALPALLVKKERVTKPLRKPAWKATSLPDFVQSSLAVIHSYQLCLRSNREQVWFSTVLQ